MISPLLNVTNLSKSYDNIVGCKNISMSLYPGEVLGIVGESGSDKTTFINCLSGSLEPDRGKIIFNINNQETDFLNISVSNKRKIRRIDLDFVNQEQSH